MHRHQWVKCKWNGSAGEAVRCSSDCCRRQFDRGCLWLNEAGIDAVFSIQREPLAVEAAMDGRRTAEI